MGITTSVFAEKYKKISHNYLDGWNTCKYTPFSVISGQWKGDNKRLCTMSHIYRARNLHCSARIYE